MPHFKNSQFELCSMAFTALAAAAGFLCVLPPHFAGLAPTSGQLYGLFVSLFGMLAGMTCVAVSIIIRLSLAEKNETVSVTVMPPDKLSGGQVIGQRLLDYAVRALTKRG